MSQKIKISKQKTILKVQANEKYVLVDETGKSPEKIKMIQKGKDLEIYLEDPKNPSVMQENPSVEIKDYYAPNMNAEIDGLDKNIEEAYVYNKDDGWYYLITDTAFGFILTPLGLGVGAAGAAGVAVAAGSGGGGSGGNDTPTTPAPTTPVAGNLSLTNFVDSGSSSSDNISNDNTFDLTISGQTAGTTVIYQISTDGGITWIPTTANQTSLADGTYQFRAIVSNGSNSVTTPVQTVTVDTTAIAGTLSLSNFVDTGSSSSDNISNDNTFDLTLTGQEAGSTVVYEVSTDGGITWIPTTANQTSLADGTYSFRATVTDVAGNSATTPVQIITIDTTVANPTLALATDSGTSNSDGITNVSTINVSNLESGATWEYSVDGGTWTTGTGTTFTASSGSHTYSVRQTDTAGNTGTGSSAVTYNLDTTAIAGTLSLSNFVDSGSSTTDNISNDNTFDLTISGNESGSTVVYEVSTDGGTTWTTTTSAQTAVSDGIYQYRAVLTDTAGNTATTPVQTITIDTTAIAGTLSLSNFVDSGSSTIDNISNDNTFDLTISGNETGSTVVYEVSTDGGTTWTTTTANQTSLTDGTYSFRATVTDVAGNTATTPVQTITIDTSSATFTTNPISSSIDLGILGKLILPTQADGKWYYYWDRNGNSTPEIGTDGFTHNELDSIFVEDINRNINPGADTTNVYRYAFINGVHVALPTYGGAVNALGQPTTYGAKSNTTISDGATINPTYDDLLAIWDAYNTNSSPANGLPSGWSNGYYWSATPGGSANIHSAVFLDSAGATIPQPDTTLRAVALEVLDPGIVVRENTPTNTVIYDSNANDNMSITYSISGVDASLFSVNSTTGEIKFLSSPDYENPLDNGGNNTYNITLTATDIAGNIKNQNLVIYVQDVYPYILNVAISSDNEAIYSVLNAGDTATMTVTMNEIVTVDTTNGIPTIKIRIGNDLVDATYQGGSGTNALTFTYTILSGQNDSDGISIPGGIISLNGATIKNSAQENAKLNFTLVMDNNLYQVDTTVANPTLALATDSGSSSSDGITNVSTINVSNLETNATWEYSVDGGTWTTGTGTSFTASSGSHTYSVRQTDTAGNTSTGSSAVTYELDTTAIAGTLSLSNFVDSGSSSSDNISNDNTFDLTISGNEAGSTVVYEVSTDGGTTWTTTTASQSGLVDGTYSFRATATDVAGNTATTPVQTVTVDITPPTAILNSFPIKLEATGVTNGSDTSPQITAVGSVGEYVVTYMGFDSDGDLSIFVQKFNADGTPQGTQVKLEATGNTNGNDYSPQITAVGSTGEYVVTYYGIDSDGDYSVFVQKFNADGTTQGTQVKLEASGVTNGSDASPQITAVGSTGEYVVTYTGLDSDGDTSIFVQKFNADGTIQGSQVKLEATGVINGGDYESQVTAIGGSGEYVVTYYGIDSDGEYSVFVQKFNSNGTTQGSQVKLEATGVTNGDDYESQVIAVGSAGEYVVTYMGFDSNGDNSIFVQKFNADGTIQGSQVKLEATGVTNGNEDTPQITAVGSIGEYVVTYTGIDSDGEESIFVQKFNADGTTQGSQVKLEATGVTDGADYAPQITAVGNAGEYVVTYYGQDSDGDDSIFVQKFNADGTIQGSQVKLEAIGVINRDDFDPQITAVGTAGEYIVTYYGEDSNGDTSVFVQAFNADGTPKGIYAQSNELGTAYLVKDSVTVSSLSDITSAADNLWNSVDITTINTNTAIDKSGLLAGTYKLYTVDIAGNLSLASTNSYTVIDTTPPTANISLNKTSLMYGDTATVNISFNKAVMNLDLTDFSSDNGILSNLVTTDNINWTATFTVTSNLSDSTNEISLANSYTDTQGNAGTTETSNNYEIQERPVSSLSVNPVQIELSSSAGGNKPQIEKVGSSGEFVVVYEKVDGSGDYSIFVQKFNPDGTTKGALVKLEATSQSFGNDFSAQVTSVGNSGEYVVTYYGEDIDGDYSVYVQKFNADGTLQGTQIMLEGVSGYGNDINPQISAVGSTGEYVVTYSGDEVYGGDKSIFVQKFNADGTPQGSQVKLEATGKTNGNDYSPQITAVGSAGEYVVTYQGIDIDGDYSVYVQKFNANGTTQGSQVKLEATGETGKTDGLMQVTSLGASGEYVVTYQGAVGYTADYVYVQKFNADGTTQGSQVKLEATIGSSYTGQPQITLVGTSGEYVMTYQGFDSDGDISVFVQKFNANGTIQGSQVKLEAIGVINADDNYPQITNLGNTGEYVVTYHGIDSDGDKSIFVQKFNANGTTQGLQVKLEATGVTSGGDWYPQITAVGNSGEYAVTYQGIGTNGYYNIYVQRFNADGSLKGNLYAQSNELGTAYLVKDSVTVTDEASITSLADNLWNSVNITAVNTDTIISTVGLDIGTYKLYSVNSSGVISLASTSSYSVVASDFVTPLMLDLNNNAVHTTSLNNGVMFDVNANGITEQTGWSDGKDGFLVLDLNKDGIINDGSELFGSGTTLANGLKAKDGYEALKQYDNNNDGVIDSNDSVYSSLQLWVDKNIDGKTTNDELHSLKDLGVSSINLKSQSSNVVDNGNLKGLVSNWIDSSGTTHEMADIWFKTEEVKDLVVGNTTSWTNSSVTSSNEITVNGNTYTTVVAGQALYDENPIVVAQPII